MAISMDDKKSRSGSNSDNDSNRDRSDGNRSNAVIYITGATGRLGRAVLARAPEAIPLVRKETGFTNEIVTDFSEKQLRGILNDGRIIIHLAGSVDTLDEVGMQEANVELTRHVVAAAPKSCRIIFASSISVYGKKLAKIPADEKTPACPDSAYSRSKYAAEQIVASHQNQANHIIMRIGTIYGPGFKDYDRVLAMIEKGKMRIIGDGNNRIPFVHVDDVADALVSSIKKGTGTYVLAGEPLTQNQVYKVAAGALGVQVPTKTVNTQLALLLAGFEEFRYKLAGGGKRDGKRNCDAKTDAGKPQAKRPKFTKEHISVLAYDRAFDCSKAKKELGFSPRQLKDGIAEAVLSYKKRKAEQNPV